MAAFVIRQYCFARFWASGVLMDRPINYADLGLSKPVSILLSLLSADCLCFRKLRSYYNKDFHFII